MFDLSVVGDYTTVYIINITQGNNDVIENQVSFKT